MSLSPRSIPRRQKSILRPIYSACTEYISKVNDMHSTNWMGLSTFFLNWGTCSTRGRQALIRDRLGWTDVLSDRPADTTTNSTVIFLASLISWATLESGPTGSTNTMDRSLRIIRSGPVEFLAAVDEHHARRLFGRGIDRAGPNIESRPSGRAMENPCLPACRNTRSRWSEARRNTCLRRWQRLPRTGFTLWQPEGQAGRRPPANTKEE